jgi:hypothetical protein
MQGQDMQVNWKRGLTRLYYIFWALWLMLLLLRLATNTPMFAFAPQAAIIVVIIFGLLVPGSLLLALRWAIDGFAKK